MYTPTVRHPLGLIPFYFPLIFPHLPPDSTTQFRENIYTTILYIFRIWDESKVPGGKPGSQKENMHTPHRHHQKSGLNGAVRQPLYHCLLEVNHYCRHSTGPATQIPQLKGRLEAWHLFDSDSMSDTQNPQHNGTHYICLDECSSNSGSSKPSRTK